MLFNSFNFWLVFPIIFTLYWLVPSKYQTLKKWALIFVSYLLYINWKPSFALVLIGVTLVTFYGAIMLSDGNHSCSNHKRKKVLCITFAILSLLPLLIFKYYNFINESVNEALSFIRLSFSLPGLNWAVPIGISFYTFQALGYLWDVYYGKIKAERNLTDYVLFCSFFPQTASGPISKYTELMPQIKATHPFRYNQARDGLKFLLWGMFLKVVVADRLGIYVDTVYANYIHFSNINCFIASVFYTFQIYGDFAGYSLMAVGIGKCLGFDLINNFRRPYFATSITDFWKRWHISLTRWLTTYIYIPLGGNRCSKGRQYYNIMITFLVSGIWHGANWTFLLWGIIHGVLQCIEKIIGIDPKGKYYPTLEKNKFLKPFRIAVTFLCVSFAWIFFRMPSINDACGIIMQIFTGHTSQTLLFSANNSDKLLFMVALLILISVEFRCEFLSSKLKFLDNRFFRFAIYVLLFVMIISVGVLDASQFIYVSF